MKKIIPCVFVFLYFGFSIDSKAQTITLYIDSLWQPAQSIQASYCDTLQIINRSGYSTHFVLDTVDIYPDNSTTVFPDSTTGLPPADTSWFYNTGSFMTLFIYHQVYPLFYSIDFSTCMTGIPERNADRITLSLFPNPSGDRLHVHSTEPLIFLKLINESGKEYPIKQINGEGNSIDVSNLDAGTYCILLLSPSGNTIRKKFIKV